MVIIELSSVTISLILDGKSPATFPKAWAVLEGCLHAGMILAAPAQRRFPIIGPGSTQ
jgi:hypothetical protein